MVQESKCPQNTGRREWSSNTAVGTEAQCGRSSWVSPLMLVLYARHRGPVSGFPSCKLRRVSSYETWGSIGGVQWCERKRWEVVDEKEDEARCPAFMYVGWVSEEKAVLP